MIKYIEISMACKPHVAAFLLKEFSDADGKVLMRGKDLFYKPLLLCLDYRDYSRTTYKSERYSISVTFKIPFYEILNRGDAINVAQAQAFNNIIDIHLKTLMVNYIDLYMNFSPHLFAAVDSFMNTHKISDDDWSRDAIIKYYYRLRKCRANIKNNTLTSF